MTEYITELTKEEIKNHPSMRDDILKNFDNMIDEIEDGHDSDRCLAVYVRFLDNFVRNQPQSDDVFHHSAPPLPHPIFN